MRVCVYLPVHSCMPSSLSRKLLEDHSSTVNPAQCRPALHRAGRLAVVIRGEYRDELFTKAFFHPLESCLCEIPPNLHFQRLLSNSPKSSPFRDRSRAGDRWCTHSGHTEVYPGFPHSLLQGSGQTQKTGSAKVSDPSSSGGLPACLLPHSLYPHSAATNPFRDQRSL